MNRFVAAAAALVVWAGAALGWEPKDSAVAVYARGPAPDYADIGSGTVIASEGGRSLVLTAAHVCSKEVGSAPGSVVKVRHCGTEYKARWLAGSSVTIVNRKEGTAEIRVNGPDLALLVVDEDLPPAQFAPRYPDRGARVRLLGFAGRSDESEPAEKTGTVLCPAECAATPDARSGDSGGGLFDADGRLIGVVHSRPRYVPGTYAVGLSPVREWVRERAAEAFPRLARRLADGPEVPARVEYQWPAAPALAQPAPSAPNGPATVPYPFGAQTQPYYVPAYGPSRRGVFRWR